MKDSEAKKKWDNKYTLFVGFKLFRKTEKSENDQDIIDFIEQKNQQGISKGEVIKLALREYMRKEKGNR